MSTSSKSPFSSLKKIKNCNPTSPPAPIQPPTPPHAHVHSNHRRRLTPCPARPHAHALPRRSCLTPCPLPRRPALPVRLDLPDAFAVARPALSDAAASARPARCLDTAARPDACRVHSSRTTPRPRACSRRCSSPSIRPPHPRRAPPSCPSACAHGVSPLLRSCWMLQLLRVLCTSSVACYAPAYLPAAGLSLPVSVRIYARLPVSPLGCSLRSSTVLCSVRRHSPSSTRPTQAHCRPPPPFSEFVSI